MENIFLNNKSRVFSYSVLAFTLFVVISSLVSIVFPKLLVRFVSDLQDNSINPFELGFVAIPFLIVDSILIGIIILNNKKKLPSKFTRFFGFIQQFDVSWKTAFVIIIGLFAIYFVFTLSHIFVEETFGDYEIAKSGGTNWSPSLVNITGGFKYFLLHASIIIFKNIRMVPLITSFLLLLLVYFTTLELTKNRFGSIVAVMIVLQSNNFLTYDSTASYANFWIFFYLLSLLLVLKKWYLSHVSYVFSIFSKGLTAIFIPMTLFFTLSSEISSRRKVLVILPYIIMGLIFAIATQLQGLIPIGIPTISYSLQRFWEGFTSVSFQLRNDWLVLFCLLPLVVTLYIRAKQKIFYAYSAMFFIAWTLFSSPLLAGLTTYTLEPYRQIPVVIFFAIGVGILFSNRLSNGSDNSKC